MIETVEVANVETKYNNPIAELVQTACKFDSHIIVKSEEKIINAKSLMGMMAFGLRSGMIVEISAEGDDEAQAVDTIKNFLACK